MRGARHGPEANWRKSTQGSAETWRIGLAMRVSDLGTIYGPKAEINP